MISPITPRDSLNTAFLKVKPNRSDIEKFKINLIDLLDQINESETEEFHKNIISKFLDKTYYSGKPAKEQQKYLSDLKVWTDKKAMIEGDKTTENSLNYFADQLDYLQTKLQPELEKLYSDRKKIVETLFEKKQELTSERKKLFQPISKFIEDFRS